MAIALAVIHWEAKVDAMDIELVIESAAATPAERRRAYPEGKHAESLPPPSEVHSLHFKQRSTHFWVRDFDKATPIKLTANDVDRKLVPAFLGNEGTDFA